jgi:hypothetical protein
VGAFDRTVLVAGAAIAWATTCVLVRLGTARYVIEFGVSQLAQLVLVHWCSPIADPLVHDLPD